MSSISDIPSAERAAITNAAPALKSGADICAPVILSTPSIYAVLPSTLIWHPIRFNSSTYLNLFSNMLSVTILVPWASARTTAICGCISVGNPGYGNVLTLVLLRLPLLITLTQSSPSITSQPTSISLADNDSRCLGITSLTTTSPRVAADANINVPASIWSGIIE